jgi:hypothetical protein
LFWREFSDGHWLPDRQRRFVALIALTNTGEPIVDLRSMPAIMAFRDCGKPVLWGEASPDGAVMWRPEFYIARIEDAPGCECISHYRLVEEPA